ncbi:MAG: FKBP-type peptidyl-prolyl cis-trans isomerase [Ferruginibacter sp.]
MSKNVYLIIFTILAFSACKENSFKKGSDGLEYKIISSGSGPQVQYGNFLQMQIGQYYNNGTTDSLLSDSRTTASLIEPLDSVNTPKQYYDILKQLKKGDSLVIRILVDSAFKKSPEQMPPFLKKGHYLTTTVKVLNIFTERAQADSARNAAMAEMQERNKKLEAEQVGKDEKLINEYLQKNNVQAVKAPGGTYVQIIDPGTGANIDTTVVVKTNYTGRTLEGKAFDSNTDPAFNHVEPFMVNMTNDPSLGSGVIKGWTDGLTMLKKGAKAKFFIPSSLGYGAQGAGGEIPPFTSLVFDIEVVDVLNKAQAQKEMQAQMQKAQMMQQRMTDSMQRANPQPK